MRPIYVGSNPVTALNKSVSIIPADLEKVLQLQTIPNPFSDRFSVRFVLPKTSLVGVRLFDSKGSLVKKVFEGTLAKGSQQISVEGTNQAN